MIRGAKHKLNLLIALISMISACQKSDSDSASGEESTHPGGKGTNPNVKQSAQPSLSSAVSLTADTVIKLGTTSVTIRQGTIAVESTASLTSTGTLFANTIALTAVSEAVMLNIVDAAGVDIARTAVRKDIEVSIDSGVKVTSKNITALFKEDYGIAEAAKSGIKQSGLVSGMTALAGNKINSTFKIRNPRMAMVLADTAGNLPGEYKEFVRPPTEVESVTASAVTPSDIQLTWKADASVDGSFSVVAAVTGAALADCSNATIVTVVYNRLTSTYSYTVPDLNESTSYSFNICGASLRSPVDFSPIVTATATTPSRAKAILTNAPTTATSNVQNLDVTVSGEYLTAYRYALIFNGTTCTGAAYSAEVPIATHIVETIPTSGAELLCVLGTIDASNLQLVPTQSAWTIDITPPVFTSLALANDASDFYVNTLEKLNVTAINGALVAAGYDTYTYAVSPFTTACSSATYAGTSILSSSLASLAQVDYKICAKLEDIAGNVTYGNSVKFTLDYTPPSFTSASLANDAADGYINNTEKSVNSPLITAATGMDIVTSGYAAVSSATTCDGSLTYSAVIPSNPVLTVDGSYKVCVKLIDVALNYAYGSSGTMIRKTTMPTISFASVSVGNPGSTLTPTILGAASESSIISLYFASNCATATSAATASTTFTSPGVVLTTNVASNASTVIYGIGVDVAGNPSACTNLVTYLHDSVAPTVGSVTSSTANGSYKVADAINVTINFSETVYVTGTPQMTLETGGTDAVVNYVSGSPGTALIFTYTVGAGQTSADLDYVATNSLALNSGTIKDLALNNASLTLASPGAANSLGNNKAIVIDTTLPVITYSSISPVSPSSSQTPQVTLTLSEATATSSLELFSAANCTGSTATAVTGVIGSNAVTTTSLAANAVTNIYALATDAAGNVSACTSMTAYTHDNISTTVTGVTSTTPNASYKVGSLIAVTVTFSEAVDVTGTPQLTLETGSTDAVVNYASGSGSTVLTFNYTVAASETSANLDYQLTSALALNGGAIKDLALNNATLTLASPGAANSLGNNKAIIIDTTLPTLSFTAVSVTNPGSTLTPTILGTGSETSTVTLYNDVGCSTEVSSATSNTVFASPGIVLSTNTSANTTTTIYGVAVDTALNASACTNLVTYTHDNISPTVTGVTSTTPNASYKVGSLIAVTVTFSEVVDVTGTPQITLETGSTDAVVNYASGSGSTVLTFNYTVAASETSANLDYQSTSALALIGGAIKDLALNNASLTLASPGAANSLANNKAIIIDTTPPVITFSSISPVSPGSSQTPQVTLTLSEATATSSLELFSAANCTGSTATAVTGVIGSNAVTTTGLTANAVTNIYALASDAAGNVSACTSMTAYAHDNISPTVTGVTSTTPNASYKVGSVIAVRVTFSEAVDVTGIPQLTLETGSTDAVVNYASGSGSTVLTFNYTVAATETSADLDYVATNSLALNGGTIKDLALNDGTLTLASPGAAGSLGNNKAIIIDTTLPTLIFTAVSVTNPGSTLTPTILGTGSETSTVTLYNDVGCSTEVSSATSNTVFASPGIVLSTNASANTTTTIYGVAVDTALNASVCTSLVTYTHDGIMPTVTSVSSATANGYYKLAGVMAITVTFSESVTVTGTPQLTLETGGTDAVVNYSSGSPGTVLTFNYTVAAGETSTHLDYAATTSLALNSATIRDSALNAATLTLAAVGAANSLGANKSFVIDTTAPTIGYTSISPVSPNISQTPAVTLSLSEDSSANSLGLFSESGCTSSIATAITGASGTNVVTTSTLTSGSITTIYAKTSDLAGNVSVCTSMVSYTQLEGVGSWTATTVTGAPAIRYDHTAVWTGSKMIVWGGGPTTASAYNSGGAYDLSADSWTATTTTSAPSIRKFHTAVWTGTKMIVWGGSATTTIVGLNDGGVYDPEFDSWSSTTSTGAPGIRAKAATVWTGTKMIVWGGSTDGTDALSTGGIYDPFNDSWTAITDTGAPAARYSHKAVWTGTKMIVWGGTAANGSDLNTGGVYDPNANTWTATTATSVPSIRTKHSAVWADTQMVVWGGGSTVTNTGGVYQPISNAWTATTTAGAPEAVADQSAIWTGSLMIVWGGYSPQSSAGGRYNPSTDAWTATTSTIAPAARYKHTAVWTGSKMIIWGGFDNTVLLNSGGIYTP